METVIILLMVLLGFAGVAFRWGFDGTESVDSPEWERRRQWSGFH